MEHDAGPYEAFGAWQKLVDVASVFGNKGNPVSPWDILAMYTKKAGRSVWVRQGDFEVNQLTGEKRYVGPKFKTTTSTQTDLTDPATAHALATQVFQQMMGRDPGKGEIGQFADALRTAEEANPVETVTTTEFDSEGNPIGETSRKSGGMDAEGKAYLAQQQVKKKHGKEFGAYQAATTYQNALEQAVYGAPE